MKRYISTGFRWLSILCRWVGQAFLFVARHLLSLSKRFWESE